MKSSDEIMKLASDVASMEHQHEQWAKHYLRLLELIPLGMADGTGIFTPESWIEYAKKELGYTEQAQPGAE